jgi:hypothetical protein
MTPSKRAELDFSLQTEAGYWEPPPIRYRSDKLNVFAPLRAAFVLMFCISFKAALTLA